jgi:dephospho-CoA kinase
MAYVVGLAGGIGSGKTLVANIFSTLGIPVFNADEETKIAYDTDTALRTELTGLLGNDLYEGPRLNRRLMAARIFADKSLLEKVNALVHPLINERFLAYAAQQQSPYVMMESAILFEAGLHTFMQKTIAVTAPEALRIARACQRDNVDEAALRQRMQHQWADEQRNALADFVLVNDGKQALLSQVMDTDAQLRAYAQSPLSGRQTEK